jgi:peptidylprolyl isomerase
MDELAILGSSPPSDWEPIDPHDTLYLDLPAGRAVIALAPAFAPNHVANAKALVRERYFDGAQLFRVQDNYVVEWGWPDGDRQLRHAERFLAGEFERPAADGPEFTPLSDGDVYAAEVGFASLFPAARDLAADRMWLCHCYGTVGSSRFDAPDSGAGTSLYAVIGHAPRHLDRNASVLGRVVLGMDLLSALPRGTGPQGRVEKAELRSRILGARVAADVPPADRLRLESLRAGSETFQRILQSRRYRAHPWFRFTAGCVDLANAWVPVRNGACEASKEKAG